MSETWLVGVRWLIKFKGQVHMPKTVFNLAKSNGGMTQLWYAKSSAAAIAYQLCFWASTKIIHHSVKGLDMPTCG